MSDDVQDNEVEQEARELGWVPKEEFRGDPEKWVTAEAFVEHGRHVMPILRKNNERLLGELRANQVQVKELADQLAAAREDFDTLQEFHNDEITRRVDETRKSLLAQIKAAKTDGDVDAEVTLQGQLTQLEAAAAAGGDEESDEGEEGKNGKTVATQPILTPAYLEWKARTPWFDVDLERSYEAMAIATRIAKEKPDLRDQAFFAELDRQLSGNGQQRRSKVEGSRGGSTQRSGGGRTYADLDADARAQCDKYAQKFVKKGGKFETVAAYREHYVKQLEQQGYFTEH